MTEEVLIVKVLSLLWLSEICEVVSFLVVHSLFLDWSVGRLPSPLVLGLVLSQVEYDWCYKIGKHLWECFI